LNLKGKYENLRGFVKLKRGEENLDFLKILNYLKLVKSYRKKVLCLK